MHPSCARDGTGIRVDSQTMPRILIVAYGNPLRCDDGVAWRAADALERNICCGDVEILRTHQLAPELAEAVSRSRAVIFIDAAIAGAGNSQPGEVRCAQVGLPEGPLRVSHQLSPGAVVALARQLYGASPRSFSVTLTGHCFDHGESLSPAIAASLPALVTRIEALVQEFLVPEAPSGPASPGIRSGGSGSSLMTVAAKPALQRLRITLRGAVQGIGFRPFVYRLATEMSLTGWVLNCSAGLVVEVEGASEQLTRFEQRLEQERPKASVVTVRESAWLASEGSTRFEIHASDHDSGKTVNVLPDLATCTDCREELFDPGNRRFEYPFTNCTNCGPRYTIVVDIPYDRLNSTMRGFTLCPSCREEYENSENRRFHAQPNACPVCGPQLDGTIEDAAEALVQGEIVALKGIGGFQLLVDARNPAAVARLRQRKHREEKPFALMMPSLEVARSYCEISPAEVELLESQAAPIVLLQPRPGTDIAGNVAHGSPYLGVMLPYSPLHHLLLQECRFPLIATSGNRSDEPIATSNDEAKARLKEIADHFLMHNRPIVRACDDSVVRLTRGRAGILRRARGYAPLGIHVAQNLPPVLAVGGHLKNSVAIGVGEDVFLSQHIGDLETLEARGAFEKAIDDLCRLYSFKPEIVVCDLHPDYASTHWAEESGLPLIRVQHHQAHVAACAAENGVEGEYLGIAWDGTGYGLDGAIWGGEFFYADGNLFERIAHLRSFGLPGGDAAVREGWRSAASLIFQVFGPEATDSRVRPMLERSINVVPTTSVGRLFDAVACITGVAQRNRFEGQAAMLLENEIGRLRTEEAYPLPGGDWAPLILAVMADKSSGVAVSLIAARFHNALVEWILEVAATVKLKQIVLSGGVFQNRYLTERAAEALESRGFVVYTHQQVPPNDGGLALGQAVMSRTVVSG